MSRRQHSKGLKRPRSWHRSKRSSRVYWRLLNQINEAEKRAEAKP